MSAHAVESPERVTKRPNLIPRTSETSLERGTFPLPERLLDAARHGTGAHRAQRLAESEGTELVGLADDRLTLGGELAPGHEERRAGDLTPCLHPVEARAGLLAGVLGDAGPAPKLRGELSSAPMELVALDRGLRDPVLQVVQLPWLPPRPAAPPPTRGRARERGTARASCAFSGPAARTAASASSSTRCAAEASALERSSSAARASASAGSRAAKASSSSTLARTESDLAREPVEIRERGAGLLVSALELPQDSEDPFGHYDGVTR